MPKCLFLGCPEHATHKLTPQYGKPSWWCREHGIAAHATAEQFANRQLEGPRLSPGPVLRLPRPIKEASAS